MDDMGQVGPVSLFLENSASMLDPALDGHNPDAANSYAKIQTAKAAQTARDVHDGTISGSVEGVRGGIAERVADNRESKAQKSERESRRADETAFFLALMQNGGMADYIGEQMFGGMNDDEVFDYSARMVAETGKSIQDWAAEILGDEAAQQRASESNADYHRRLHSDVLAAIKDPNTGEFLPEYSDHPLASFTREQQEYKDVMNEMTTVMAAHNAGQSLDATEAELASQNITDGGIRVEFASAATDGDTELDNVLRKDRDVGSDNDLADEERIANNDTAFSMFNS